MVGAYVRACVKGNRDCDILGRPLNLERGKLYLSSEEREDGTVVVFGQYFHSVPSSMFMPDARYVTEEEIRSGAWKKNI